jgi:multiple sugar transport system substrate-binding protein
VDHSDVVAEIERADRRVRDLGRRSTYNPGTKTYFGVSDGYVPSPTLWRHDVWESIGAPPTGSRRDGGAEAAELGHPIGIGQSGELDSNMR